MLSVSAAGLSLYSSLILSRQRGAPHKDLFACCELEGWHGVAYSHHEQVGKDHGRLERRQCRVIADPQE